MMNFEAIKIGISQKMSGPAGVGYVGVPVWLWAKDPTGITVGRRGHHRRPHLGLRDTEPSGYCRSTKTQPHGFSSDDEAMAHLLASHATVVR